MAPVPEVGCRCIQDLVVWLEIEFWPMCDLYHSCSTAGPHGSTALHLSTGCEFQNKDLGHILKHVPNPHLMLVFQCRSIQ